MAAAGCVGVMIPPSNPFVVYGVSSQVSIGDLFMGGIVPGILTGIVLMLYCYFYSKKRGWRGEQKERNWRTLGEAFWEAKWALVVPVIVLGGIYGGILTPTEARPWPPSTASSWACSCTARWTSRPSARLA